MNITERIEEMAAAAKACTPVSETTAEFVEIIKNDGTLQMMLVNQTQILAAQAVILRNLGLNLARETGVMKFSEKQATALTVKIMNELDEHIPIISYCETSDEKQIYGIINQCINDFVGDQI